MGCAVHLLISGAVAALYGWAFDMLTRRAGADLGVAFGLVHGALAAVVVSIVQMSHPLSSGRFTGADPFMWNAAAADVVVLLAAHGLYGAIVGALCERVRCGPPPVSTVG